LSLAVFEGHEIMEDEIVGNVTVSKRNAYRVLVRKPGDATWNLQTWSDYNIKIALQKVRRVVWLHEAGCYERGNELPNMIHTPSIN